MNIFELTSIMTTHLARAVEGRNSAYRVTLQDFKWCIY